MSLMPQAQQHKHTIGPSPHLFPAKHRAGLSQEDQECRGHACLIQLAPQRGLSPRKKNPAPHDQVLPPEPPACESASRVGRQNALSARGVSWPQIAMNRSTLWEPAAASPPNTSQVSLLITV